MEISHGTGSASLCHTKLRSGASKDGYISRREELKAWKMPLNQSIYRLIRATNGPKRKMIN